MEIWIPGQAEEKRPKLLCRVCGDRFVESLTYERHVVECSNKHDTEIRESSMSHKFPNMYGPEAGVPDLEQWVDKHRDEIIEGRKKM